MQSIPSSCQWTSVYHCQLYLDCLPAILLYNSTLKVICSCNSKSCQSNVAECYCGGRQKMSRITKRHQPAAAFQWQNTLRHVLKLHCCFTIVQDLINQLISEFNLWNLFLCNISATKIYALRRPF